MLGVETQGREDLPRRRLRQHRVGLLAGEGKTPERAAGREHRIADHRHLSLPAPAFILDRQRRQQRGRRQLDDGVGGGERRRRRALRVARQAGRMREGGERQVEQSSLGHHQEAPAGQLPRDRSQESAAQAAEGRAHGGIRLPAVAAGQQPVRPAGRGLQRPAPRQLVALQAPGGHEPEIAPLPPQLDLDQGRVGGEPALDLEPAQGLEAGESRMARVGRTEPAPDTFRGPPASRRSLSRGRGEGRRSAALP